VTLKDMPHRRLTRPKKVFEFFFDGALKSTACEGVIKLEPIADGYMNAICFWFDLHLDEEATITSAPDGVGKGGQLHSAEHGTVSVRLQVLCLQRTPVLRCLSCTTLTDVASPCAGLAKRSRRSAAGSVQSARVLSGRRLPPKDDGRNLPLLGTGAAVPGARHAGARREENFCAVRRGARQAAF
jgi:hypothetical protein